MARACIDERQPTLTTSEGVRLIPTEKENPELIAPEFMEAVKTGREPAPGWSVLLAMRVLHQVQPWDARHGKQVLSGRPVT